jgi:hypothetical protein
VFPGKNGSERSSRIKIDTQLTVRSVRISIFLSSMSSPTLKSTRSNDVSWGTLLRSIFVSNYPASASGYIPLPKEILGKDEWLHCLLGRNFWVLNVHYVSDTNIAMKNPAFETQTPQYLQTCEQIVSQQRFKYLPEGRTTSPTFSSLCRCL